MEQFIGGTLNDHVLHGSPLRVTNFFRKKNGHNHPVEVHVEKIKSKLRKRAREEVVPIPAIYNDALVELSTQQDHSSVIKRITEEFTGGNRSLNSFFIQLKSLCCIIWLLTTYWSSLTLFRHSEKIAQLLDITALDILWLDILGIIRLAIGALISYLGVAIHRWYSTWGYKIYGGTKSPWHRHDQALYYAGLFHQLHSTKLMTDQCKVISCTYSISMYRSSKGVSILELISTTRDLQSSK